MTDAHTNPALLCDWNKPDRIEGLDKILEKETNSKKEIDSEWETNSIKNKMETMLKEKKPNIGRIKER